MSIDRKVKDSVEVIPRMLEVFEEDASLEYIKAAMAYLGYIVDEKYPPQYHPRFGLKKTLIYRILIPKNPVDWAVLNDNPDTKLRELPFVYEVWEEGKIDLLTTPGGGLGFE